ncbi:MAG: ribosome rescue protein RqcH [Halobacteriota archaeon]|nr:ribosome rescue protein RqcH [Halobacteriota archaeon]
MKEDMSNLDVAAVVTELQKDLIDSKLHKIYQHTRDEIRLKLYIFGSGYTDLIIECGKRIHLTKYPRQSPRVPPAFPMFLRKHLKGGRITEITQHGFDRIVEIHIKRGDSSYILISELFSKGNLVILDEERKIMLPMKHMTFTDRKIKKGEYYQFPISKKSPMEITEDELSLIFEESNSDVIRTLASRLNLGGMYAEEICLRAGIEKNRPSKEIAKEELSLIHRKLIELTDPIKEGKLEPQVILKEGQNIDAIPLELEFYRENEKEKFGSFNEALDEFFSKKTIEEIIEESTKVSDEGKGKLERRIDQQRSAIEKFRKEIASCDMKAEKIYENYNTIEDIIGTISGAREKGYSWSEIKSTINDGRDRNTLAQLIKNIDESVGTVSVDLSGATVDIDINISIPRNAQRYYDRIKVLRGKLVGAEGALEHTLEAFERSKSKEPLDLPDQVPQRRVRIKEHWFDRFRWFETSGGLLAIGGRDADTNEELVKKYMEGDDIFFHTQAHGAPVVILKTGKETPSDEDLREVALFSVSYSNVWKAGQYEGETYWVTQDQVSKTPQSGEYIEKGSFIIRGKRNYFKKVPVDLSIGIEIGDETRLIGGPKGAIGKRAKYIVELEPGEEDHDELSKRISRRFFDISAEEDKRIIKTVASPDKIVKFLPPGGSRIKSPG